ncbi:MAG TPA: menaquinone biosynthesis protein [Chitinophagaceae bacterium]|nr:menaquinone biosynthesis protein [Chitinophagaceae bacterium]
MDNKVRVGIVNYLNTKPLLYGLQHSPIINDIVLVQDYPAAIAKQLQENTIDMGLVPVAVIPKLPSAKVVGNYCIGADGPVASVCLFSEVPITQVKTVLLDYQSRTSVELAKLLLREHWRLEPELVYTKSDYQADIQGTTAGLVIGDRALAQRTISPFIYDLGEAWKIHTGKPFVFAAWIANKELDAGFIEAFDEANALGLQNIENVLAEASHPSFSLEEYFTRYIQYKLDDAKREGMQLFLEKLAASAAHPS